MAKKVLGKGLEALIPQSVMESVSGERVVNIAVERIRANPYQPRKRFDAQKLESLAESLRREGLLQPIVVRKKGEEYELVMGERRLQAARLAGIPTIPAILKDVAEADSLRLALVENLQREDLNPLEVAQAYKALVESFGLSQNELAGLVGKDRSSVANTMRLLGLPEKVKVLLREGKLSEGHARAILALSSEAEQIALAGRIVEGKLSVRRAEEEAGLGKRAKLGERKGKEKPAHIAYLENAISNHLGTRVFINERRGGRGRIIIEFYSHEDFERLSELMHLPIPR